jgi:hypothetical protein
MKYFDLTPASVSLPVPNQQICLFARVDLPDAKEEAKIINNFKKKLNKLESSISEFQNFNNMGLVVQLLGLNYQ